MSYSTPKESYAKLTSGAGWPSKRTLLQVLFGFFAKCASEKLSNPASVEATEGLSQLLKLRELCVTSASRSSLKRFEDSPMVSYDEEILAFLARS